MNEHKARVEVADYGRRLHQRGWVANHDGNVSVQLAPGRYLCTPTATSKAEVTPEGLLLVDEAGHRISGSGSGKVFSEIGLHLTVYRQRPDVRAVMHAHPVTATGFAVAGCALDVPFLAEAVVSLGPEVPLVPPAAPGPAAEQALSPYATTHDAVLLSGNGVLSFGDDLEQAYLRLELCEHLARIALVAQQLGGVRRLPPGMMAGLLEARRKAGLGPENRGIAPARGPIANDEQRPGKEAARSTVHAAPEADLASVIRQEVLAALRQR